MSELAVNDTPLACRDCGAICSYRPIAVYDHDRCPECELAQVGETPRIDFGTLATAEAMVCLEVDHEADHDNRPVEAQQ